MEVAISHVEDVINICEVTDLSVDKLNILRALRVAVARSVLGTSLVVRELGHTTILVHRDEVDGAVKTARKVRHVDVEGELLIHQLEHLVVRGILHEVDTGADVGAGHELDGKSVAASGDTVSASIVSTIEGAVLSAADGVSADGGVPRVAGVAVGVAGGGVDPTPVGVKHNGSLNGRASAGGCAVLSGKRRVGLGGLSACLLTVSDGEERESEEGGFAEHVCD